MGLNFFTRFFIKNENNIRGRNNVPHLTDEILNQRNLLDVEKTLEIDKNTLEQIFQYQFSSNTKKPFFIIGTMNIQSGKQKFHHGTEDGNDGTIEIMLKAEWYFFINPNGTNHLIYTKDQKWIQFNKNKQVIENDCINGNAWGYGGGTFQADKFTSRTPVFITGISLDILKELFNKNYTH